SPEWPAPVSTCLCVCRLETLHSEIDDEDPPVLRSSAPARHCRPVAARATRHRRDPGPGPGGAGTLVRCGWRVGWRARLQGDSVCGGAGWGPPLAGAAAAD